MFGSTIEFVLRSYTNEYNPIDIEIATDGSMHLYKKENHPTTKKDIFKNLDQLLPDSITTPIYPFEKHHLPEILKDYQTASILGKNILIYADSTRSAELNILFQYHKIAHGTHIAKGLGIFANDNSHNIVNWNSKYQHWNEMKPWELREWFSLFYMDWIDEWINSSNQVPDTFLKIKSTDILFDSKTTFLKIINFCNLTVSKDLDSFINNWFSKQQYILTEFDLIDQIVENTINECDFNWKNISIVSEAIIQQRLRSNGYEIRCDGLNTFPTNSNTLYNLLERC